MTLFYSVIDPARNQITYANAGHNPGLLWRTDGTLQWLGEGGLMLSPVSILPYDAFTIPFNPGDCLCVYSDGVTEAENAAGALWEEKHLEAAGTSGPRVPRRPKSARA